MFKKLNTFLTTFCLLNLLMVAGLLGFMLATGRLDAAKATVIADLVRHPGTPATLREDVAKLLDAKTAPATATSPAPAGEPLIKVESDGSLRSITTAADRVKAVENLLAAQRAELESQAQRLRDQRTGLDRQQAYLDAQFKQLAQDRTDFEKRVRSADARTKDEAFTKSLALYKELKPKQVKDIFLTLSPEIVADYLRALETEQATRIVGEFKTEEERKFIAGVLEKIRTTGTAPALAPAMAPAMPPAGSANAG